MRYVMLIYHDQKLPATSEEAVELKRAFGIFHNEMQLREISFSSEALLPVEMARTVRVGGEGVMISDGPFAETKEQIGGVFIVDCADWDVAVEVAGMLPVMQGSVVEIRPILPF